MNIQSYNNPQALALKNRIDGLSQKILERDGQPGDLDERHDAVCLTSAEGQPLILPASHPYKEEIVSAQVTGNQWSHIDSKQYYDSSYGRSAESGYTMEKEVKDGQTIYRQRYYDPMGVRNHKSEARFDASGELVKFKHKEFAATWGEALRDVFTSPAGLGLVAVAGVLGGCPGTLGYALAGSVWPGVVTAGATAVGLAYAKTRPW